MISHPRFLKSEVKKEQSREAANRSSSIAVSELDFFDKTHWAVFLTPPRIYHDSLEEYDRIFDYQEFTLSNQDVFKENDWITHEFPDDIKKLGFFGLSCHGQLVLDESITDKQEAYDLLMKMIPYCIYVTVQDRRPIKDELRQIARNPETGEIRPTGTPWGARSQYQIPHLIAEQQVRKHLSWLKGEKSFIERAIRKTAVMDSGTHLRLRLISTAVSSYYNLEHETVLELLGRVLELKAKAARDTLALEIKDNSSWAIWKCLHDKKFISDELFTVVNFVRRLRNKAVHEGAVFDGNIINKVLTAVRHIVGLDWYAEGFGHPKEFTPNAAYTWESEHGPNNLRQLLKPCPDCGVLSLPGAGC
ncbi:MAG: hypothetical protein ACFFD4_33265, partial [Candidatus Odinarchaeota archaeon]